MKFEYRVNSDHFSWDDLAFPEAIDQYTTPFWPFGRQSRAREKLEEKQQQLLEKHGIEKQTHMGITTLVVPDVEDEEQAKNKMEDFKDDVENFYQEEFGIEQSFEYSTRDQVKV